MSDDHLVAYELRDEYAGTTEVVPEEGAEPVKVPTFQGGRLYVGDGDFAVAEALEAGNGKIVVKAIDQRLIELLSVYPALKRCSVPRGSDKNPRVVISPYKRRSVEDLRQAASLRDVKGAGSLSKERAIQILDAMDEAQQAGDQTRVAAIASGDTDPTKEG
jgi:hypothetical protein